MAYLRGLHDITFWWWSTQPAPYERYVEPQSTYNYLASRLTNGDAPAIVRIPFWWQHMQPTLNGSLSTAYLDGWKLAVERAHTAGLLVIGNIFNYTATTPRAASKINQDFTLANYEDFFSRFGAVLQAEGVYGMDIQNEPNGMPNNTIWKDMSRAAVRKLRAAGYTGVIWVEGCNNWSNVASWGSWGAPWVTTGTGGDDPLNKIVYSAHSYPENAGTYMAGGSRTFNPASFQSQLDGWQGRLNVFSNFCSTYGVKGSIGEVGVPSEGPAQGSMPACTAAWAATWNSYLEMFYDWADLHDIDVTYQSVTSAYLEASRAYEYRNPAERTDYVSGNTAGPPVPGVNSRRSQAVIIEAHKSTLVVSGSGGGTPPPSGGGGGLIEVVATDPQALASGGTTLTWTKPAGLADGDFLVWVAYLSGAATVSSAPSGSTQRGTPVTQGLGSIVRYYKAVSNASGEPASYTLTASGSADHMGVLLHLRNVDTASPFAVAADGTLAQVGGGDPSTAGWTTWVLPTITPTVDDALLIAAGGIQQGDSSGSDSWGMPAGMTERADVNTGTLSSDRNMFVATEQRVGGANVATGTRTFTASHGFGNDDTAGVLMALKPSGTTGPAVDLIATPGQLAFTGTVDGSNPANQTISVTNQGGTGDLTFTVSDNASWLSTSASNSSTAPSTVTVSVNITGLAAGSYNATITVDPTAAGDATITIPVTLTVNPVASSAVDLRVTPTSLSFTMTEGGPFPPAQTVSVTNIGGAGDTSFSTDAFMNGAVLWLTASVGSTAPATVTVTVGSIIDVNDLTAGQYTGSVEIDPAAAGAATRTVDVSLTVVPATPPPVFGELVFDAAGGALGAPLDISRADVGFGLLEHHYPLPPVQVLSASSIDTEGESPGRIRYANRTITIRLEAQGYTDTDDNTVTIDEVLDALAGKLAKINDRGGTLRRRLPDDTIRTYDLVAVTSYEVEYDHKYYEGRLATVDIVLEARPFSRGPEESLTVESGGSDGGMEFTVGPVPGDVPALGRLVVTNASERTMNTVIWAAQANPDTASSAALIVQAEDMDPISGTVTSGPAGSTGGVSSNTLLTSTSSTASIAYIKVSGQRPTHAGTFRVFARAQAPNTNPGIVTLSLQWAAQTGGATTTNTGVALQDENGLAAENEWYLLDLGMVTLDRAQVGTHAWDGKITMTVDSGTNQVYLDSVWMFPVDDRYAEALGGGPSVAAGKQVEIRHDGVLRQPANGIDGESISASENIWTQAPYEGDPMLVPVGDQVRMLVKACEGERPLIQDYPLDMVCQVYITPRYL